jgi:regulator of protease activity HflC (stomatin/prohibitin superfamily)
MKKTQRRAFVPAVILSALALAGCSATTPPDMVALHFGGGMVESKSFKECMLASSRDYNNGGDSYYMYPTSQRNLVFDTAAATKDSNSYTFVTKDGIEMTVSGIANFRLNTECEALLEFHNSIGARNAAYFADSAVSPPGWSAVVKNYVGTPLDTAIDRAGQKYTYTALYNDPATKAQWEKDVLALLPDLVNRQTDGDAVFFDNWAVTLQKPEPPQAIKDALVEQQAAVARANAAKSEADAQVITAKAQKALEEAEATKQQVWIDLLGKDGWLEKYAIEKGLNPLQPGGTPLVNTP